ncbi:MAG: GNAT family N-acetyltransferase [Chloroflexia bacterium]
MCRRSSDKPSETMLRSYDPERDYAAVLRIWQEAGWVPPGKEEATAFMLSCGRPMVAELEGQAECFVQTVPGTLRYLEEELPFSGVAAVATSRVARRRGLAGRLTALAVALDAAEGALVSGLGVFEQGFYDRLGFGTGPYEHFASFDPAHLRISARARIPRRLTPDDWALVHASRQARRRGHGAINLHPPEITRMEMAHHENGFGLGYCDGPHGELTHHLWFSVRDVEHGPYFVPWMTFQNAAQFQELMALLRDLSDQVRLVRLREPPGLQFQDLLLCPFRARQATRGSKLENWMRAAAPYQVRLCDLEGCLARTHLPAGQVRFNLHLSDPIAAYLDETAPWHGLSGEYVVTLGVESGARLGTDPSLPTLRASVGAFTRLWLGVQPAGGLSCTDDLAGPPELLARLDELLRLPPPLPDWDF